MTNNKPKIRHYFYGIVVLIIVAILVFALVSELTKKEIEEELPSPQDQLEALKMSAQDQVQDLFVEEDVREPAVAGAFYPKNKIQLEEMIENFLANAQDAPKMQGEIIAMMAPHAGYEFSGQAQAYVYQKLKGNNKIRTVVLVGPSHSKYFDGVSVYPRGYYKTPLGKVRIDAVLAKQIMEEHEKIFFRESAHQNEHSLEVQIPFLQKVLPKIRIVPIIFGNKSEENINILTQAILKHITEDTLIVASSDLSHYPSYKVAQEVDKRVLDAITSYDTENLKNVLEDLQKEYKNVDTFLCGEAAVKTMMLVARARGVDNATLLKYYNSGDTKKGDKDKVVGYGAVAFSTREKYGIYNEEERKILLNLARTTVESYIKTGETEEVEAIHPVKSRKAGISPGAKLFNGVNELPLHLQEPKGAFVTIKKQGNLRGCIGDFEADKPLIETVQETAIAAATKDQRFQPVSEEELAELNYEISILSPLEKINDPLDIILGRHGVMIKIGYQGGVFLPQVAEETGWDFNTFMGQLCAQKAGLSSNCWQEEDTQIFVFTAEVFGE